MKKSIAIITALVMLISLLQVGMVSADEVVTPEPITVTASVASGATVFAGEKIKLTFSEAISEESLAGITVSGGVTPAFEAETENTAVEITVPETAGALTIAVAAEVGNETNTVAAAATFTYNVVNLLFDMEINGTDGAAVDQVNATVNATAATQKYLLTKNTETGEKYAVSTEAFGGSPAKPVYHKEGNLEYLTFKEYNHQTGETTNDRARVSVPMDTSLQIANKDNLTIETWIRRSTSPTNLRAGYFFTFGKARGTEWSPNTADGAFSGAWYETNGTNYSGIGLQPDLKIGTSAVWHGLQKDTATTSSVNLGHMEEFNDKWVHIVMTREYQGNNKWQSVLYVNGNKRTAGAVTLSGKTDYNDTSWNSLMIGSQKNADGAYFTGDISTFKLYDGVFDDATVRKMYSESSSTYYNPSSKDGISKFLEVKVEDGAIVASSDADAPAPTLFREGMPNTNQPAVKNEKGVEYMQFGSIAQDGTITDDKPRLTFKINDIDIVDDTVTFTAWIRHPYMETMASDGTRDKKMTLLSMGAQPKAARDALNVFRIGYGLNATENATAFSFMTARNNNSTFDWSTTIKSTADLGDITTYTDDWADWTHYAITKKWVPTRTDPTKGYYEHKFYVNNVLKQTARTATLDYKDWSEFVGVQNEPDSADYITIGGGGSNANYMTFMGDIAHFTLYSGELDAAQVAADYYATCAPFVDSDVLGTLTMQGGAALTAGNIDQATEVNIDGLILKDMGENEPVVFLAVYGDEDSTKLIGVALADITVADGQIKFNAKVDGLTQGTAKHVKALVWDGFSSIRPLTDAVSCL